MSYEIGELVIGKVINVKPYALFMSFEDESKGLLHISEISNSFIRDIEKFGTVGDLIKVKVIAVDPTNNFLRVSLKKVPNNEMYSTHSNEYRQTIDVKQDDFALLEKMLPIWKNNTLKQILEENENEITIEQTDD